MELDFGVLARVVGLTQRVWDAAALICLEKGPQRYTDLGDRLAEWSGQRPSDSTVTRTVNRLRSGGFIGPETVDGGRGSPYVLTDTGRARLGEIRAAFEMARVNSAGTNGTSGQGRVDAGNSTMEVGDRPYRSRVAAPWDAQRGRRDGQPLGEDIEPRRVIDTSVPHPARRYNYWLGGKDHFEADRVSGDELARIMPTVRLAVLENRSFQGRAIRELVRLGIRQFLDIGTGIPAPGHTHEVAQAIAADTRVVYVDNDPIVLSHARALLTSSPEGRTAYLDADLRDPGAILGHPDLLATLDLSRPVGLLLMAVLHFLTDEDDVVGIVGRLVRALPAGSYLVMTHVTPDFMPPEKRAAAEAAIATGRHGNFRARTFAEISTFFDGLELVRPGLVPMSEWRPTAVEVPDPADVAAYGAVARKPNKNDS